MYSVEDLIQLGQFCGGYVKVLNQLGTGSAVHDFCAIVCVGSFYSSCVLKCCCSLQVLTYACMCCFLRSRKTGYMMFGPRDVRGLNDTIRSMEDNSIPYTMMSGIEVCGCGHMCKVEVGGVSVRASTRLTVHWNKMQWFEIAVIAL